MDEVFVKAKRFNANDEQTHIQNQYVLLMLFGFCDYSGNQTFLLHISIWISVLPCVRFDCFDKYSKYS